MHVKIQIWAPKLWMFYLASGPLVTVLLRVFLLKLCNSSMGPFAVVVLIDISPHSTD